jgi:hypothetical protein
MTPPPAIIPAQAIRDTERKTTRMWFHAGGKVPDGEYDIRGGLCWPVATPEGGITGFAVILGRHLGAGCYYWLDETPFLCVDHVLDEGRVAYQGIAPWFSAVGVRYFIGQWYYNGDRELAWRYMTSVKKSVHVIPKPTIAEVEWVKQDYPVGVFRELKETGRLAVPGDSAVVRDDVMWAASAVGSPLPPSLVALCAVLVGMEAWRWDGYRRGGVVNGMIGG